VLNQVQPALARNPDDAELHYLAGQSLHSLHRNLKAVLEHYNRALTLGFDEAWVRCHRGRLLRELGRNAEAKADLTCAANLKPDDPEFQTLLRS
jgi:Flp pilus assembly protein TadD